MINNKSIQHDIEDAVVTIKRLSKGVQPLIERMIGFCLEAQPEWVKPSQMTMLTRSVLAIEEEANKLLTTLDHSVSLMD